MQLIKLYTYVFFLSIFGDVLYGLISIIFRLVLSYGKIKNIKTAEFFAIILEKEDTIVMTTIRELCNHYNYTQTTLAKRFGIPLRSVQDWHAGRRTPPDYVVHMMEELLQYDKERNEATSE